MSRIIKFPKIDWSQKVEDLEDAPPQLSPELEEKLRKDLDAITEGKRINPHVVQSGLRAINFHVSYPEIYKIIDDLCLDYDINKKDMSTDDLMSYIVSNLADNQTRKGLNLIFESYKNPKKGEITSKELAALAAEVGHEINEEEFHHILKTISGPTTSEDINQDEFYYIMTKKPEEALKITMATKVPIKSGK